MTLVKSFSLLTIISTLSFAQTTMCFKQNVTNLSSLETVKLDGGLCNSQKSLSEMKKDGWKTEDIKIDGNNYIYILKKDEVSLSNIDMEALEAKIMKKLEQKNIDDKSRILQEKKAKMSFSGKALYEKKCQKCHGIEGEKEYSTARALNTLSFFEFQQTLRDYDLRQYDRGQAFVMYPFANTISSTDIKNIYQFLKSTKEQKKPKSN